MIRRLIILLLIVGCDETLEPEDVCGVAGGDGSSCTDNELACLLGCEGFDEMMNNEINNWCVWFEGLGGLEAECFDDCENWIIEENIEMDEMCEACADGLIEIDCAGFCGGSHEEDINGDCCFIDNIDDCGVCGGDGICDNNDGNRIPINLKQEIYLPCS